MCVANAHMLMYCTIYIASLKQHPYTLNLTLPFPLPGQPEGVEPGAPGAAAAPFSAAGDVPGAGSEEVLDWAVCPMPHPPQPGHPPQPQQPQPQPPQPQPQPGIIIGRAPPIIIGFMACHHGIHHHLHHWIHHHSHHRIHGVGILVVFVIVILLIILE